MKANDLRIGNYFIRNNIVSQVHPCIIEDVFNGKTTIKPIPITEEWLLKFGFYYQSSDKNYVVKSKQENNNSIKKIDGDWCYNNDYSDASCYFVRELRYIHELQNLYYALNEEELTIK